jgi:hypothetical protein
MQVQTCYAAGVSGELRRPLFLGLRHPIGRVQGPRYLMAEVKCFFSQILRRWGCAGDKRRVQLMQDLMSLHRRKCMVDVDSI